MNVTCDKCNKRYSIADEKVRGKSVKIRCKQCQNLISVQGPPADGQPAALAMSAAAEVSAGLSPAPGSWQDERTRPRPALDYSPTWYAMVKGKQIGPMTLKEMEQRVKATEISLRTYLWKQGMGDWKRASDVPEVSPVFAGVSVGASATGPATSATPTSPERPASKALKGVQRDVATSNEMPSPELTSRPAISHSSSNGHGIASPVAAVSSPRLPTGTQSGVKPAMSRPVTQSGIRAVSLAAVADPLTRADTAPSPMPAIVAQSVPAPVPAAPTPFAQPAPLNDLFSEADLPGSGQNPKPDEGDDGQTDPRAESTESPSSKNAVDPFAALGEADPSMAPPPGEATKFFIAQAGVNKRNPPWKIALFAVGMLGLPVAALYLLASLHVVPLEVKHIDENGQEVSQPFFSAQGVAGLKDLLTGEEKRRREAAKKKAELQARAEIERRPREVKPNVPVAYNDPNAMPDRKDNRQQFTEEELKKLYGVSGNSSGSPVNLDSLKTDARVKVKPVFEDKPVVSEGSGLSAKAVSETVGKSQNAFQMCIEQALHKNPNMKVGKVTLVVEVGASGTVKTSGFEQKAYEMSDWGSCIRDRAKRMVFPQASADEETRVEIPLVVGVAMQ